MIKSLHITNYALIDEIEIDFSEGFNIITGETGAGKSIILGALTLLLGGRADTRVIRRGERKSIIEAVFSLHDASGIKELLSKNDLDAQNDGELILRRELAPQGRTRAFINDTPVKLPLLREVAERLVDIHSQHENQLLVQADYQIGILDSLAANDNILVEYRKAYNDFRKALKDFTDTRDLIRRSRDDADFIQFQYEQLSELSLVPGEQTSLEQEREILSNADELKNSLSLALDPLVNLPESAVSQLSAAIAAVRDLADTLNDDSLDFNALADRLETARIDISDVADTLSQTDIAIAADPERLAEVEERLGSLYSLELKHHVSDADALIELRDNLGKQLEALENADLVMAKLEAAAKRAKKVAWNLAEKLSESREKAAAEFSDKLQERAKPLGMPNLRFEVSIIRGKLGADGFDQIQFLCAFNKNQTLMPVGDTASGGEISRLMLTIKSIVAEKMHLPAIIFDEVDTGVSGDIAVRMGSLMAEISKYLQVITITHLPGVAALGNSHYKVYKEDDDTSTNTRIRTLSDEERASEIAFMISGSAKDETALANARALLQKGLKHNN